MNIEKEKKSNLGTMNMNEDLLSLDEKRQMLGERAKEIAAFLDTLSNLKNKLQKKKETIKEIITKKIEENERELRKWKELLFIVVDESLDEKIEKLSSQEQYFKTTHKEIESVLESSKSSSSSTVNTVSEEPQLLDEDEDSESEDPKMDDLLALEMNLQPDGLTQTETTEMESRVKNDFNTLLNEPKKSLRRTFAYVGGIIRGYLRRGKSDINWIKIMRRVEGREFEERMLNESDPYLGTKLIFQPLDLKVEENVNNTWNSMTKLFENRNNTELRSEFCEDLYKYYENNPEDVEFYLPQLINLLLNQYTTFQPLKEFILEKCKQSVHFALQTYLLVRASKDSREPPKKKKIIPPSIIKWRLLCNQLMTEIQNATSLPTNTIQNSNESTTTIEANNDIFQFPIQFMDSLVEISRHLTTVPSEQYEMELTKELEKQDIYIQSLISSGLQSFIYIPLLKPVGSADYHRVVRIPAKEAYPIPTYGRVLYYLVVEVIDKEKEEKKKLSSKKKKEKKEKHKHKEIKENSNHHNENENHQNTNTIVPTTATITTTTILSPPLINPLKKSEDEIKEEDQPKEPNNEKSEEEDKKEKIKKNSSSNLTSENEKDDNSSDSKNEKKKKKHHKKKLLEQSEVELGTSPPKNLPSLVTNSSSKTIVNPYPHSLKENMANGGLNANPSTEPPLIQRSMIVPGGLRGPLGSHTAFGELWNQKAKRIKLESQYGNNPRWRIQPLIIKSGEEVLQEEFAMQLIVQFQRIFLETGVPVKVLPYRILAISSKAGFIEPIPNSLSLDKLKKQHTNLLNFFIQSFGETSELIFKQAQQNFVKTMAAYSIICYLLQIKDRHNGNILLDASGHIIHIDFGYLLSKTIAFEKAPFKLTSEFVEVMGGYKSPCYKEYCKLCVKSFLATRKHYKKIMLLVEMTMEGKGKKVLPCLQGGEQVLKDLLERFHLDWSDEECEKFVLQLIEEARGSWRTIVYDAYQLILNNIH